MSEICKKEYVKLLILWTKAYLCYASELERIKQRNSPVHFTDYSLVATTNWF